MQSPRLLAALLVAPFGILLSGPQTKPTETLPVVIHDGSFLISASLGSDPDKTNAEALAALGITTPVVPGAEPILLQPVTVHIMDGDEPAKDVRTYATTVGAAIADADITLSASDSIQPKVFAALPNETTITITRIYIEERLERTALPFPIVTQEDPEIPWRTERVVQQGSSGIAEDLVRVRLENGREVFRTLLHRTIQEEPRAQIIVRGTKISVGRTQDGGASWYRFRGGDFAASTTFRRGSWLRVTNLKNGTQVIVRVNDYGPTIPGRVIDLDAVAYQKLAPLASGVIPVRVEEIL